jgi:hypothetical protein
MLAGMKSEQPQLWQPWPGAAQFAAAAAAAAVLVVTWLSAATAQDIRGMEICTAEKQMDRRTGCLQANVQFLQQAMNKLARETDDKIAAADRNLASAKAEIAVLKSTLERLSTELEQMKAKSAAGAKK